MSVKGAEDLLGAGDMLIRIPGEPMTRAHGVFLKAELIAQMVASVPR